MTLNCPTCKTSLTQRLIGSQTIDDCTNCSGAWYDSSELSTILGITNDQQPLNSPCIDPPDTIDCPRCQTKIESAIYAHDSGIPILKCSGCNGVWLTAGQLERIANYRNGPHQTDRLGHAMAETFVQSSSFDRVAGLLQSRVLSLIFAAMILILAAFFDPANIAGILRLLAILLFPLACIWFSDAMGSYTSISMGGARRNHPDHTRCRGRLRWLDFNVRYLGHYDILDP